MFIKTILNFLTNVSQRCLLPLTLPHLQKQVLISTKRIRKSDSQRNQSDLAS